MFKYISISLSKILLFGVLALFMQMNTYAQEENVINNKGTIITVRNNVVTTSATTPIAPVENDVWYDTATNETKIYDGTVWKILAHIGTTGSVFFAAADGTPTEDNSQLFWDDTNNRLGVGTASPTNKLEVEGATRTQGALNSDGTVTEPSYRFSSDSNTGMYRPAADEIGFTVGGIEALKIDEPTTGNTVVIVNQTLDLDGPLLDENDSAGTAGQVLTTTVTGTEWVDNVSPIKAFGKIADTGAIIRATTGVTITKLTGDGHYQVNLPTTAVTDANYIIQLTQPGRNGVGNDDPGIAYSNQTATSFEVIMGDNDNGGTDRARFDSEFMFTIIDL